MSWLGWMLPRGLSTGLFGTGAGTPAANLAVARALASLPPPLLVTDMDNPSMSFVEDIIEFSIIITPKLDAAGAPHQQEPPPLQRPYVATCVGTKQNPFSTFLSRNAPHAPGVSRTWLLDTVTLLSSNSTLPVSLPMAIRGVWSDANMPVLRFNVPGGTTSNTEVPLYSLSDSRERSQVLLSWAGLETTVLRAPERNSLGFETLPVNHPLIRTLQNKENMRNLGVAKRDFYPVADSDKVHVAHDVMRRVRQTCMQEIFSPLRPRYTTLEAARCSPDFADETERQLADTLITAGFAQQRATVPSLPTFIGFLVAMRLSVRAACVQESLQHILEASEARNAGTTGTVGGGVQFPSSAAITTTTAAF